MSTLMTLTDAARELGVHKSTISRQVAAGQIPNRGTARAPMVDVDEARRARDESLDPSKQRGPDAPLFAPERGEGGEDLDDDAGADSLPGPAPARGGARSTGELNYLRVRTAREAYAAKQAQLDYEREAGQLCDRAEVQDAFYELGQGLRDGLERRAHSLAQRLAGMTDIAAIRAVIAAEDEALLKRLTDDFARRAQQAA